MKKLNWKRIGLHVLFWSVYLLLNALLNCIYSKRSIPEAFPEYLIGEAFSLPVKMLLTYFVFYYVVPLYIDRNRQIRLVASLVLAFGIAILAYRFVLGYVYSGWYLGMPESIQFFNTNGLVLTAFDLFITLAAAFTIKFIRLRYQSLEFEQQLTREKLESELNFLRAQTNPHFLFNTLNNLYVLARKKSDKTPEAIMMLSKIMRFVLYDCRAPSIAISEETKVIQDYIELEKLRYNQRLKVTYESILDDPQVPVAPLLLLPFVENSFKHGASNTTGDAEIDIRVQLSGRKLTFSVRNTIEEEQPPEKQGGIGLGNVRRQLDLIYPGRHHLVTKCDNGFFMIELIVDLN
jgi:sensor histidine kinase YesM